MPNASETAISDAVSEAIADMQPVLRQLLRDVFHHAVNAVNREKLADAIHRQDRAAVLALLGITTDAAAWPSLDLDLQSALATALVPVFERVSIETWETLGEPTDPTDDSNDLDPAVFNEALDDARASIIADTLDGIGQAITLIFAGASYGLGAVHLLAAIGMTAKQATLFIVANRAGVQLQDRLSKAIDDATRATVANAFLAKLPTLIQSPLRRLLAKNNGRLSTDDIRVMSKNLAMALVDYRTSAIADVQTATIANLAEIAVWQAAQKLGLIPTDSRKFWVTRHDEKVRHTHAQIEAMNVRGVPLDGTFANPLGIELHAPPAEIHCRCRASLRPQ